MENTGSAFSQTAHNLFNYNERREVNKSEHFDGSLASPGSEVIAERREYLFDHIGNRENHAEGGGAPENYASNALNQYSQSGGWSHAYDADGNLEWSVGPDVEWNYWWDGENRLISAENTLQQTASFTYDYKGRRVRAVFNTQADLIEERYVWDEWNLLMVLDGNSNPVRKFTWGLDIAEQASGLLAGSRPGAAAGGVGALLATTDAGTSPINLVYFYDANGNVGQLLDWQTSAVAAHYEYDPFGKTIVATGSEAYSNRFRFSTKHLDLVTDIYYYGYRFYSPETGRWLNRDPINESGSMLVREADKYNWDEELSLYAMVKNDPVNHWDLLGLEQHECTGPDCTTCGCDGCSKSACRKGCWNGRTICGAMVIKNCIFVGPGYLKCVAAGLLGCNIAFGLCMAACQLCPCP